MKFDDISFDDDYVDDIIASFFADDNSAEIVAEGLYVVADGQTRQDAFDQYYDVEEPTDDELDAIESASV